MNNIKKVLATLLIFCMIAPATLAFAAFTDVSDAYVDSLTEKGIFKRKVKGYFCPLEKIYILII